MPTITPKTFLSTGVSSGLGLAFADHALDVGHRVIGTVRKEEDADRFAALAADRAHPLILDVTNYATIPCAVAEAERCAGTVEVLVNNAGYGHEGALEESSMDDLQRQFPANVYGPVASVRAVLPGMRERHSRDSVDARAIPDRLGGTLHGSHPAPHVRL